MEKKTTTTDNREFKHESLQDRESIVKYLNALCEGFIGGKLVFGNGHEQVTFQPKGLLNLDVKAKRKEDRVKLTIKFAWKEDDKENGFEEKLVIKSKRK